VISQAERRLEKALGLNSKILDKLAVERCIRFEGP
jgi:hypothetical protein